MAEACARHSPKKRPSIRLAAARAWITARNPTQPGLGLSLEKLDRLIDYQPEDMTITVEAGMTLAELSKILIKRRQRLPIDVARPDRATIGGAAGHKSLRPATIRLRHAARLRARIYRRGRPRHDLFRRRPGAEKQRWL